jgi:hypothetical protein
MSTCPLNNGCSLGNCEFCSQKTDCILMAILQKVERLKLAMEKLTGQTA